jgi:hypothetical protein
VVFCEIVRDSLVAIPHSQLLWSQWMVFNEIVRNSFCSYTPFTSSLKPVNGFQWNC